MQVVQKLSKCHPNFLQVFSRELLARNQITLAKLITMCRIYYILQFDITIFNACLLFINMWIYNFSTLFVPNFVLYVYIVYTYHTKMITPQLSEVELTSLRPVCCISPGMRSSSSVAQFSGRCSN